MSDITIPPEAVEAATDAVHDFFHNTHSRMFSRELARAALRAGIAAWPGMECTGPTGGGLSQEPLQAPLIILPLPQEPRDE